MMLSYNNIKKEKLDFTVLRWVWPNKILGNFLYIDYIIWFTHVLVLLMWGACSRWPLSLYCLMRNSDQMTIKKTHTTLLEDRWFHFVWIFLYYQYERAKSPLSNDTKILFETFKGQNFKETQLFDTHRSKEKNHAKQTSDFATTEW